MKKTLQVALEDQEIIELMRILLDEDAEGALDFLRTYFLARKNTLEAMF